MKVSKESGTQARDYHREARSSAARQVSNEATRGSGQYESVRRKDRTAPRAERLGVGVTLCPESLTTHRGLRFVSCYKLGRPFPLLGAMSKLYSPLFSTT